MKLGLTMMACFSLAIGIAHAQTAPAPADAKATPKKDSSQRMVCHEDNEIGSLVHKKRICLTAAQWRQVTAENANEFERHTAMKEGQGSR